jgi:hypothetical protein
MACFRTKIQFWLIYWRPWNWKFRYFYGHFATLRTLG